VEPPVIEHMWALMHEDQPFLLKEDKRYATGTPPQQRQHTVLCLFYCVLMSWYVQCM